MPAMKAVGRIAGALIAAAAALAPVLAGAQKARLVKDIEATTTVGSDPWGLVVAGGRLFFFARPVGEYDGSNTLYATAGTAADLKPLQRFRAALVAPVALGSQVVFAANEAWRGGDLWTSDGTTEGTVSLGLVAPYDPVGPPSVDIFSTGRQAFVLVGAPQDRKNLWRWRGGASSLEEVATFAGRELDFALAVPDLDLLFFTVEDTAGARRLWRSDGTAAGTRLASPDMPAMRMHESTAAPLGSRLVLAAQHGATTWKLWRSDGTPAGTVPFFNWHDEMRVVGAAANGVFFVVARGELRDLWWTDGTTQGTREVRVSFHAGLHFVAAADRLFFINPGVPSTIYVSDGTLLGTRRALDLPYLVSSPEAVGRDLFFTVVTPADGNEIGFTDGTPSGTRRIQLNPGSISTDAREFKRLGDGVFFTAFQMPTGRELWAFRGQASEPSLVLDLNRSTTASNPRLARAAGPWVVFEAGDMERGRAWWRTDGTEAGTQLVADLNPSSAPDVHSQSCSDAGTRGTTMYAALEDGTQLSGLWEIDVVSGEKTLIASSSCPAEIDVTWSLLVLEGEVYVLASTCEPRLGLYKVLRDARRLALVRELPALASSNPRFLERTLDGRGFFHVHARVGDNASQHELWATDGTAEGTRLLWADPTPAAYGFSGESLYFACTHAGGPTNDVCHSDGTPGGVEYLNVRPQQAAGALFVACGEKTLFALADDEHGREPWITDGTPAGTKVLRDIWPGEGWGVPGGSQRWVAFRDGAFFSAADPERLEQIWYTDGTGEGTRVFEPLLAQEHEHRLMDGVVFGNHAYLAIASLDPTSHLIDSLMLYRTDGSAAGTSRVSDAQLMAPTQGFLGLEVLNGRLYFQGYDPRYGWELWVIDDPSTIPRRHLPRTSTLAAPSNRPGSFRVFLR